MTTIVYGASDDLIEIEGDIREEFGAYDSDPFYLAFSNGVVLKVTYDNEGIWRILPRAGHDLVRIDLAREVDDDQRDPDGCPGYSDKATIDRPVTWVVAGTNWAAVTR